jgi:hypothetical protein
MDSEVPITIAEDDDEEIFEGKKSSFKTRLSHEFPARYRDRLIAQTIVFSFLEKKEKTTFENYLIPSIGVDNGQFVIFLYDSEHDILLESKVIKLIAPSGRLFQPALLALWLVINYSITCSGVTEHMKSCGFTADFPKHVGKQLNTYQNCLTFECGHGSEVREMFEPDIHPIINAH